MEFPNDYSSYFLFLIVVVSIYFIFKFIIPVFLNKLDKYGKKNENSFNIFLSGLLSRIKWPVCLVVILVLSKNLLSLPAESLSLVRAFLIIFSSFWAIMAFNMIVSYGISRIGLEKGPGGSSLLPVFGKIINIAVWIIGSIFVISNLGYQVTPLITGLGVGGIAIALAVQNILGDLLSSLSIYFDKPFKIGDFVIVGNLKGTVKSVGVKTTRITSIDGEELVVPNKKIVEEIIQNFKKMQKRRAMFTFGVTYETGFKKLEQIPVIVRDIIENIENAEFGRAHFAKLSDFSLNFEVVYFVLSSEYADYMDVQQKINYELVSVFEKKKISFAYPTQKVFVERD